MNRLLKVIPGLPNTLLSIPFGFNFTIMLAPADFRFLLEAKFGDAAPPGASQFAANAVSL